MREDIETNSTMNIQIETSFQIPSQCSFSTSSSKSPSINFTINSTGYESNNNNDEAQPIWTEIYTQNPIIVQSTKNLCNILPSNGTSNNNDEDDDEISCHILIHPEFITTDNSDPNETDNDDEDILIQDTLALPLKGIRNIHLSMSINAQRYWIHFVSCHMSMKNMVIPNLSSSSTAVVDFVDMIDRQNSSRLLRMSESVESTSEPPPSHLTVKHVPIDTLRSDFVVSNNKVTIKHNHEGHSSHRDNDYHHHEDSKNEIYLEFELGSRFDDVLHYLETRSNSSGIFGTSTCKSCANPDLNYEDNDVDSQVLMNTSIPCPTPTPVATNDQSNTTMLKQNHQTPSIPTDPIQTYYPLKSNPFSSFSMSETQSVQPTLTSTSSTPTATTTSTLIPQCQQLLYQQQFNPSPINITPFVIILIIMLICFVDLYINSIQRRYYDRDAKSPIHQFILYSFSLWDRIKNKKEKIVEARNQYYESFCSEMSKCWDKVKSLWKEPEIKLKLTHSFKKNILKTLEQIKIVTIKITGYCTHSIAFLREQSITFFYDCKIITSLLRVIKITKMKLVLILEAVKGFLLRFPSKKMGTKTMAETTEKEGNGIDKAQNQASPVKVVLDNRKANDIQEEKSKKYSPSYPEKNKNMNCSMHAKKGEDRTPSHTNTQSISKIDTVSTGVSSKTDSNLLSPLMVSIDSSFAVNDLSMDRVIDVDTTTTTGGNVDKTIRHVRSNVGINDLQPVEEDVNKICVNVQEGANGPKKEQNEFSINSAEKTNKKLYHEIQSCPESITNRFTLNKPKNNDFNSSRKRQISDLELVSVRLENIFDDASSHESFDSQMNLINVCKETVEDNKNTIPKGHSENCFQGQHVCKDRLITDSINITTEIDKSEKSFNEYCLNERTDVVCDDHHGSKEGITWELCHQTINHSRIDSEDNCENLQDQACLKNNVNRTKETVPLKEGCPQDRCCDVPITKSATKANIIDNKTNPNDKAKTKDHKKCTKEKRSIISECSMLRNLSMDMQTSDIVDKSLGFCKGHEVRVPKVFTNENANNKLDPVMKEKNKEAVVDSDRKGTVQYFTGCGRQTSAWNKDLTKNNNIEIPATAETTNTLQKSNVVPVNISSMENGKTQQIGNKKQQQQNSANRDSPVNNLSLEGATSTKSTEINQKTDEVGNDLENFETSSTKETSEKFDAEVNSVKERRLFWLNKHQSDSPPKSNHSGSSRKQFSFIPTNHRNKRMPTSDSFDSDDSDQSQVGRINKELRAKLKKRAVCIEHQEEILAKECENSTEEAAKCNLKERKEKMNMEIPDTHPHSKKQSLSPCSKLQKNWVERKSMKKKKEKEKEKEKEKNNTLFDNKLIDPLTPLHHPDVSLDKKFSLLMTKWSKSSKNVRSSYSVKEIIDKQSIKSLSPSKDDKEEKNNREVAGENNSLSFLNDMLE